LLQRLEDLERRLDAGPQKEGEAPDDQPEASAAATGGDTEEGSAQAPSATVVGKEQLDLERISGLWPAVIDQVRESGSELLSTVFAPARPVAVDLDQAVLEVGFPPSAAFNKRKAEAPEARDRFADALRTIVGESLRPVYVLLDGEPEVAAEGEQQLSEDELIARLKSEFDAEEFDEAEEFDAEEAR
jgi:hypothetical protein